jgi:hypothetical protein
MSHTMSFYSVNSLLEEKNSRSFVNNIPFNCKDEEFYDIVRNNLDTVSVKDKYGKYATCYVSKYGGGNPRQRLIYLMEKGSPITLDTAIEFLFAGMLRFSRINNIQNDFPTFIKFFYKIPESYCWNIMSTINGFMPTQVREWYSEDMISNIHFLIDIKQGALRCYKNNSKRFIECAESFLPPKKNKKFRMGFPSYICFFNDEEKKLDNFLLLLEYSATFFVENNDMDSERCFYVFFHLKRKMPKISSSFELVDPRFMDVRKLNQNLEIIRNYLLESSEISQKMKNIIKKL